MLCRKAFIAIFNFAFKFRGLSIFWVAIRNANVKVLIARHTIIVLLSTFVVHPILQNNLLYLSDFDLIEVGRLLRKKDFF